MESVGDPFVGAFILFQFFLVNNSQFALVIPALFCPTPSKFSIFRYLVYDKWAGVINAVYDKVQVEMQDDEKSEVE